MTFGPLLVNKTLSNYFFKNALVIFMIVFLDSFPLVVNKLFYAQCIITFASIVLYSSKYMFKKRQEIYLESSNKYS